MSGGVDRLLRVNELIKREVAMLIERDAVAPAGTLVSVTGVSTSVDLRNATVSVSIFGGKPEKVYPEVERRLNFHRVEWQRHMAKTLSFKRTPVLSFRVDDTMAAGDRVLDIIAEVEREEEPGE